jgi:hypothetical protein
MDQTTWQSRAQIDRSIWQDKAQEGEFAYHKENIGRQSEAFLQQSARFFESFGLYRDDYKGKVIIDLGAGSKLRSKYFTSATIIAIEPLAERFMGEIAWCDLRDAAEVYSRPAEERIDACVGRADLLISVNVLDHCFDFERIIDNICAYLKPDGRAFLSFDKHGLADDLHPLSLDEPTCNRIFAQKGLVITEFSVGFGDGLTDGRIDGSGPYRMNYWLTLARQADRSDAAHAAQISLGLELAGALLCSCLRLDGDDAPVARLDQLSPVDWHTLFRLSVWCGVAPLFYKRLKALGPGVNVPAGLRRRLQDTYLNHSGRNIRLNHQLSQLLATFHNARIPVIALKGIYLAQMAYTNPALRPMQDLDVLVRRGDVAKAEAQLTALGYTLYGDRAEYDMEHFHFHYSPPGRDDLPVEIHWHLVKPASHFELNVDELWAGAQPARIAGVDVLALSVEHLLIYLCIHSANGHLFEGGLRTLCDIAEVARCYRDRIDWVALRRCASQWRAERCVYLTFRLACDLLAAPIPEEVLESMQPEGFDERLLASAQEQIFAPRVEDIPDAAFKSLNLAQFWQAGRLRDKLGILLRSLFPPAPELARRYGLPYPSARIYYYYPVNLISMLFEHAPVAWRLLRGDREMISQAETKLVVVEQQQARAERDDRDTTLKRWLSLPEDLETRPL